MMKALCCEIDFSNEVSVALRAKFSSFRASEPKLMLDSRIFRVRRLIICIALVRREFIKVGNCWPK